MDGTRTYHNFKIRGWERIESTAITYVDTNYDVNKDSNGNLILVNRGIG